MELIIGLLVIAAAGYFVFFRKKEEYPVEETTKAPYKVEMPVPAQDIAPQPVVAVEGAGAVEIPVAPVVEEAPAKKPRKPRAPKAEKPAAKKAAPKKAAAKKTTKKSKNA
jgi:BRCT domain type II-containing protein